MPENRKHNLCRICQNNKFNSEGDLREQVREPQEKKGDLREQVRELQEKKGDLRDQASQQAWDVKVLKGCPQRR